MVLQPFGVLEMARTGTLTMGRGEAPSRGMPATLGSSSERAAEPHDIAYSV
jgi:hypothetical protein